MKKIATLILENLCSIQEFKDHYSINGLLYNKVNLQPQGTDFVPSYCDSDNKKIMVLERSIQNETQIYARTERTNNVLFDSYDPDIVYTLRATDGSAGYFTVQKWKKTNNYYTLLAQTRILNAGDIRYFSPKFNTYQNEKWLYFYSPRWQVSYYSVYGGRINKETLEVTSTFGPTATTHYYSDVVPFYFDNNRIYYYASTTSTTGVICGLFSMNTTVDGTADWQGMFTSNAFNSGSYPEILQESMKTVNSSKNYPVVNSCAAFEPRSVYHVTFNNSDDEMTLSPEFFVFTIDPRTFKFYDEVVKKTIINPNDLDITVLPYTANSENANALGIVNRVDTLEKNGRKFIIFYNHARTKLAETYTVKNLNFYKVIVFEDLGNNELEVKSITTHDFLPNNALISKDHDRIIFTTALSVYDYKWNDETLSFDLANQFENFYHQVGFDRNSNLFILDRSNILWVEDLSLPNITKEFIDVPNFDRFDTSVISVLRITLKNNIGLYVSSKLRIELTGAVYFTDGTSSRTVTVDRSGILEIPVMFTEPTSYDAQITKIE